MKIILALVASLLVMLGCSQEHQASPVSDDESHIRAVREISNKAIRDHNIALLATTWTFDYHVVTSRNFETAGREENKDRYANEFGSKPDIVYIRTPEKIDVFNTWAMASEYGKWVGRWSENGQSIEMTGNYFAKWHQEGGQWLVRAEIFVPLRCTGGMFCEQSPIN